MIRVVIDTNVVVSAAFRDRVPEEIVLFIVENEEFEWLASSEILNEYNEVLGRKKFDLPRDIVDEWRSIFEGCVITFETNIDIDFPRDQKDAKFLEAALASDAEYLITGDGDIKEAQKFAETTIVTVSQFRTLVIDPWKKRE
ncbi:MAG: putative toxin-antitoxin system toxin component, PIN family [Pyrinomonadaceae bacterium]